MAVNGISNYTNTYANTYAASAAKQGINEKTSAAESSSADSKEETEFSNVGEFMEYLSSKFNTVSKGMVKMSKSYLKECLTDEEKRKQLFENLKAADEAEAHAKENIKGYQGMTITINDKGEMEMESRGGWVSVNEGKRSRQIAAAKNPQQVQAVLALLNQDLAQVENGVRNGMSDENEVNKVKALIQRAMKRMSEVNASQNNGEEDTEGFDAFSINMLI